MLRQATDTVYGGSELRAWRFARGLSDLGFDVCIAANNTGPLPASILGPVRIYGPAAPGKWLRRMMKTIVPGQSGDAELWASADADVYVAFGAAEYNAALSDWCKANGRPLVLFAGSDADFSADYRPENATRNLWGSRCDRCYDSLIGADALVVQTETQRKWAKERFGRQASIVANPTVIDDLLTDAPFGEQFLWIGKAVQNKRPDLALAVARACPSHSFVMILNDVANGLFERIAAKKGTNVEIVPSVAPDKLQLYFSRARALLCTSDFEGFPNTFLDAGRFGVPVLSLLVDPDGLVAQEQGGIIAGGSMDRLIEAVRDYGQNEAKARAAGIRWHSYVKRNHDLRARTAEFAAIIRGAVERHGVVSVLP